jgi:virulence-associated protein VagC
MIEKTLKLFKNGGSQAVRLPKEFRFRDGEVVAKKVGGVVYLIPKRFRKGEFLQLLQETGPVDLAPRAQSGRSDKRIDLSLKPLRRPRGR